MLDTIQYITGYRIFCDVNQMDTVRRSLLIKDQNIQQVISLVFENRPLQLLLTGQKELYILEKDVVLVSDQVKKFLNDTLNQPLKQQVGEIKSKVVKQESVVVQTENKLIEIGSKDKPTNAAKVNLAGYVRDANDGAALVGATVYSVNAKAGVVTDAFGYFSIKIPTGRNTLNVSSTGMKPSRREIMAYGDGQLVIELKENVPTLKVVTIVAEKNS